MIRACDLNAGRNERDVDLLSVAKFREGLIHLLAVLLLLQRKDKTYLDLVEGSFSEAILVIVVILLRISLGDFFRMNLALEVRIRRHVRLLSRLVEQVVVDHPIERVLAQVIEPRGIDALQNAPVHFFLRDAMGAHGCYDGVGAGRASNTERQSERENSC